MPDREKGTPLYRQISRTLSRRIAAEKLRPGTPLPTLLELCAEFQVSLRTTQLAVKALCDEGLAERIGRKLVVAAPHPAMPVRDLYLIYTSYEPERFDTGFSSVSGRILYGIRAEIAAAGNAEAVFSGPDLADSLEFYRNNATVRVRGVLVLNSSQDDPRMPQLEARFSEVRFVLLNYRPENPEALPENVCGVFNDDFAGGYQAGQYLLRRGVRHPVFLQITTGNQVYHERWRGFSAAATEQGVTARRLLMRWECDQGNLYEKYERFYRAARERFPDMDGIGCCNDTCAGIVELQLRRQPDPVPMIGYDDLIPDGLSVPVTMAIDYPRIGRYGVRQLQDRSLPRFLRVLPELKIRAALLQQNQETSMEHIITSDEGGME